MRRRRKTTSYRRRRTTKRTGKKPIGFTKTGGKYRLVFGSKKKPKLGKSSFRTKTSLRKAAAKYFKRR